MPRVTGRVRTVALNALFLEPGRSAGPETYLRGLVPALARSHPEVRFVLTTTGVGARALAAEGWGELVALRALPCEEGERARRARCEQQLLPALAAREGWSLIHSLASVAPVRPRTRAVITLHDVTFFERRTFGLVTTLGMRAIVRRAVRAADALIAVSAAARDEACAVLGLDPARFVVAPHGAERAGVASSVPEAQVRARYRLAGDRVALCVAAKRPHKNQELLLRAAPLLGDDVVVVLAGPEESYDRDLRELADELGVGSRVRFAGYVPDADLEALWRMASVAAFPTLAEGFGLPVLEAMAHGVSVACSDLAVLREVAADSALYFDPRDPAAAAAAIRAAMDDPALGRRGRERAAGFTWESAAERTFEAYERALAR
jgi:glycosyltransferase involved in cell wall biosynthesis